MVYRDIKPENIMLESKNEGINGLLKLVDFGNAIYLDSPNWLK